MAGSVQRQKVYVQVTELCLLAKALRAASIPPESPAKTRQIDPRFTTHGQETADAMEPTRCALQIRTPGTQRQPSPTTTGAGIPASPTPTAGPGAWPPTVCPALYRRIRAVSTAGFRHGRCSMTGVGATIDGASRP